jgi:hypothetical protein
MYSNAKAIRLIQDISDLLTVRLANNSGLNTVTQGFYVDANNASWPYLVISHNGTVAEGSPVVYIEISNVDAVSKDIFGNQTYAYAPHILQFGYELSGGGAPIPARADLAACEFESIKSGVRFQIKEVANGTAVTGASVNAAAAVADLDQLYWPTKLV